MSSGFDESLLQRLTAMYHVLGPLERNVRSPVQTIRGSPEAVGYLL
jgi:hypothetical protein